jgi:hypothetical protein
MQKTQAPSEGVPSSRAPTLASIAIQSFTSFRLQTSSDPVPVAVQSPVRRKPLPLDSPIVGRYPAAQSDTRTSAAQNKEDTLPSQSLRRLDTVLSPPLTAEDLFVPRNLDE